MGLVGSKICGRKLEGEDKCEESVGEDPPPVDPQRSSRIPGVDDGVILLISGLTKGCFEIHIEIFGDKRDEVLLYGTVGFQTRGESMT